MAPIFGFRRSADEDERTAGGKIVKGRRRPSAAQMTPYARPTEEPVADRSGNPNWLSGLIYPARVVASGAGKVISALMRPDYDTLSDSDSDSDDEYAELADEELNKELSSPDKSENMHLIQQLVMQETFSREECDDLIKLIKSRAVNFDGTSSNTDARTGAVMEAKKWLEEKKFGTGSMSKGAESEIGSPVDMAKSYMQDRPTWSSSSLKTRVEFETPSPMHNFKEDISKTIFHSPAQLSKMKASGLSAGSWNIMDEIRRVRSKATEELLATTPSKKIDLASFSVEDDSVDLAAINSFGLPESVGMESERLHIGDLQNNPTSVVLKQNQDNVTMTPVTEHLDATKVTDPALGPELPHSHDVNGLRNSAVDDDAVSLSAADQTLEPNDKEMKDQVDLTQDKVNGSGPEENQNEHSGHTLHANDNDHTPSGSQDSSGFLYEDSLHFDPNQEGKEAPGGRRLRPRKGRA